MLQNVICYTRENGKLAIYKVPEAYNYKDAVWAVRSQILGEDAWFEVKAPVMALVQK